MRILIINPILYTSETDRIPKVESIKDTMIYALCMGFVKNGDEPVLIAADEYKPTKKEEYPFLILWFSCRFTTICKPRCIPYMKGIGKYIKKHKAEYDYIVASEVFSLSTFCAAWYGRERLMIWHELGAHNNFLKKIPSRLWYNAVARIFLKEIEIIPRSENAKTFIERYCNHVLPICIDHGVDLEKIPCNDNKENYFVVLSQLIERKHVDRIIQSFSEFRKNNHSEYQLIVIGDGELRGKLETQVKLLGEEKNIFFTGKLSHEKLIPILSKAKALLIKTSKDNSMVSIVESIAAGTPVLTTSVPFNASYIRKNELGIVKDDWGYEELEKICDDNEIFVDNCMNYRKEISNVHLAKLFNQLGGSLS